MQPHVSFSQAVPKRQPGSLAHAGNLHKSGCLSAGRVRAPTSGSAVKVDVEGPTCMMSIKARNLVFGTGGTRV